MLWSVSDGSEKLWSILSKHHIPLCETHLETCSGKKKKKLAWYIQRWNTLGAHSYALFDAILRRKLCSHWKFQSEVYLFKVECWTHYALKSSHRHLWKRGGNTRRSHQMRKDFKMADNTPVVILQTSIRWAHVVRIIFRKLSLIGNSLKKHLSVRLRQYNSSTIHTHSVEYVIWDAATDYRHYASSEVPQVPQQRQHWHHGICGCKMERLNSYYEKVLRLCWSFQCMNPIYPQAISFWNCFIYFF